MDGPSEGSMLRATGGLSRVLALLALPVPQIFRLDL